MDFNMKQNEPKYYQLVRDSGIECRHVDPRGEGTSPEFWSAAGTWSTGHKQEIPMPNPIHVVLEPMEPGHGEYMPAIMNGPFGIQLFRNDVLEAMQELGIDNLQLYPAIVHDGQYKKEYTNYTGINIVGIADLVKKTRKIGSGTFMFLELDDEADNDLLVFRVAVPGGGASSSIIIHHTVKEHLESKGIDGLEFLS
jgi:hypothetical protein